MVDVERLFSVVTGQRVVITLVLVTAASLATTYAVPPAVRSLSHHLDTLLDEWGARDTVMEIWAHTPTGFGFRELVYLVQGGLFLLTGLVVLWLWGVVGLAQTALHQLLESLPSLPRLGLTAFVLAVMYSGTWYIGDEMEGLDEGDDFLGEHTKEILTRSLQLVLLLGGGLTILSIWEVNVNNVLIGAGLLSVFIGFAARSTFSSVFSGFVLMFSRPFEVGDWVELSDTEGQVTDVTIVNTRLRTPEGEQVVLSNDLIANSTVVNYSNESKLCIPFEVGVDYETDLEHAASVVEETVGEREEFSTVTAAEVYPKQFGDSEIVLEVRLWIEQPHPLTRRRARAQAVEEIKDVFEQEGIDIPFPRRDIRPKEAERMRMEGMVGE